MTTTLAPDTPLDDLGLSTRSHNVMRNAGCLTLRDLARRIADPNILMLENFGRRSLDECREVVRRMQPELPQLAPEQLARLARALAAHDALIEPLPQDSAIQEVLNRIERELGRLNMNLNIVRSKIDEGFDEGSRPPPSLRRLEARVNELTTKVVLLTRHVHEALNRRSDDETV